MKTVVDILIIIFIALGTWAGWKRGLIKSLVNLVGLVAIVVISYSLRIPLANFLIDKLPFFPIDGLASLSILIYNVISFIFIFIMLYCVLNIVLAVTGFIDTLLKFTVIWILPSKIGGAIIGFMESWVFVFLVIFVLSSFSLTASFVSPSKVSNFILDKTPILGNYLGGLSNSARDIYEIVEDMKDSNKDTKSVDFDILMTLINYNVITPEKAQELVDTGKLEIGNIMFVRPTVNGNA